MKNIIINGSDYAVLNVNRNVYKESKPGMMERYLKKQSLPDEMVTLVEFHVRAKNGEENFERTFVLSPQEYYELFPEEEQAERNFIKTVYEKK